MTARVFDDRQCALGEGPLWHPAREQLFWFDITGHALLCRTKLGPVTWKFDAAVSAAGWLDADHLLVASDTALWRFNLSTGSKSQICPLESTTNATRSNDGRADPWGGFWISTMGRDAEPGAGAIYRLYQGTLRKLFSELTIPNAICFAPDRSHAYFTDTAKAHLMRVPLDQAGWPAAPAEMLIDLAAHGLSPDGAVVDNQGALWIAQWGAGRVAVYDKDGTYQSAVDVPGVHSTCPAFGGPDLTTLYVTSATQGLDDTACDPAAQGLTFMVKHAGHGVPEPQVVL
ncbi:SMP-30/gluconolactonase/LRE family protein [Roseobacter sp.]|uniref:SMP-30/gluconolactonase/LRE family protein n=1 Tax=Roseobacter sp. TaxID=1907202 RepID=UPI0032971E41